MAWYFQKFQISNGYDSPKFTSFTVIILQCISFLFNEDKISDKIVQEKVLQQQQPAPPRQRRPLGNVIGK